MITTGAAGETEATTDGEDTDGEPEADQEANSPLKPTAPAPKRKRATALAAQQHMMLASLDLSGSDVDDADAAEEEPNSASDSEEENTKDKKTPILKNEKRSGPDVTTTPDTPGGSAATGTQKFKQQRTSLKHVQVQFHSSLCACKPHYQDRFS